jgi:hypothetical protein
MNAFNFIKATIVCGGLAFLIYSFPVISQIVAIGLLGYGWLFYAHKLMKAIGGRAK